MSIGRGPQVVYLNDGAQLASRGAYGRTMRENVAFKELLEGLGTASDGYTVDGTTRTGLAAEDALYGREQGTSSTINVRGFGAQGDGTTDDSVAFQNAADEATGGVLYVPPGRYLISCPIALGSETLVLGAGPSAVMLADLRASWGPGVVTPAAPYMVFTNRNPNVTPIIDRNITIAGLTFDYTLFKTGGVVVGDAHAIRFHAVRTGKVLNCLFYDPGDAVAAVECDDILIDGNSAFNCRNCSYDVWGGSTNVRIVNNFAQTPRIAQMINFNASDGPGALFGRVDVRAGRPRLVGPIIASGFVLTGNTLVYNWDGISAPAVAAILLDPLNAGEGNVVRDVTIANNTLTGVWVRCSGTGEAIAIADNTFRDTQDVGAVTFESNGSSDGPPKTISVTGNIFVNPATSLANFGVVTLHADDFLISDNIFQGTAYYLAMHTDTRVGIVGPNYARPGTSGVIISGTAWTSSAVGQRVGNNRLVHFTTTSGSTVQLICDDTNVFNIYGTNADGSRFLGFSMPVETDSSLIRIGRSVAIHSSAATQIRIQGAADGVANSVSSLIQTETSAADATLRILGKGNGGVLVDGFIKSGAPILADIPTGCFSVFHDSAGGTTRLWANVAGVLKSVALT